jgi:hypothetical protein
MLTAVFASFTARHLRLDGCQGEDGAHDGYRRWVFHPNRCW